MRKRKFMDICRYLSSGLQEFTICTSSSGNDRETAIVFHVGEIFKLQKQLLSSTGHYMSKSSPLEHYMQRPTQQPERRYRQNHNRSQFIRRTSPCRKRGVFHRHGTLNLFIKRTSPSEHAQLPKEK